MQNKIYIVMFTNLELPGQSWGVRRHTHVPLHLPQHAAFNIEQHYTTRAQEAAATYIKTFSLETRYRPR